MALTTEAPTGGLESGFGSRKRLWFLLSILLLAGLAAVLVAARLVTGSDSDEFTHVYELNGNLEDKRGGPALVATGGTVGPDGFVFQPGDGLSAAVDLGESYTIELRVRLDEVGHAAKLLDFRDLSRDAGFYVFEEWRVLFWFAAGCAGEVDASQGCPMGYTRQPLGGFPAAVAPGSFVTVSFVRDGATASLSADVDGTAQTWEVVYPPGAAPDDATGQRVDHVEDFLGEATQSEGSSLLHVLLDDRVTSTESGRGELDYLKIAVQ